MENTALGGGGPEANAALNFASFCISLSTHPCAVFFVHKCGGALTITSVIDVSQLSKSPYW